LVNGSLSRAKTDLYRLGVGQPLVERADGDSRAAGQQADTPANFCAGLLNLQTAFIAANQSRFSAGPSPVPATGSNLFTFLAARLSASFANLGCAGFGLRNTVSLTQDAQGVAVAAAFSLVRQAPGTQARQTRQDPQNTQPTPTPSAPFPVPSPWTPWTPWDNGWAGSGTGWGDAGTGWGDAGTGWGEVGYGG
jgi:hypothetical protein